MGCFSAFDEHRKRDWREAIPPPRGADKDRQSEGGEREKREREKDRFAYPAANIHANILN